VVLGPKGSKTKEILKLVYVVNKNGNPLMPCKEAKARHLLKSGKARVLLRCPFTICLNWECEEGVQEVVASLITSSSEVGVAVKRDSGECLYAAEIELRQNVTRATVQIVKGKKKKVSRRMQYRRPRRNRKTRYRQCRNRNRTGNYRQKYSPTLRSKIEGHEREVRRVEKLLPVTRWLVVRGAKVEGHFKDGSLEEQWLNVQRQVFERDGFRCRHCKKGKRELHAHHLEARKDGGLDTLENLVTLCKECHGDYHRGLISLKIGKHTYKGKVDTEVAIIRKNLVVEKSEDVYGFQVKAKRNALELSYSPLNDACAALNVKPSTNVYGIRCIPRGDYQRTRGRHSQQVVPKGKIMGFNRFDKVRYLGKALFIKMRMSTGYFKLTDINNKDIPKVILGRKLKLLGRRRSCLIALTTPTSP